MPRFPPNRTAPPRPWWRPAIMVPFNAPSWDPRTMRRFYSFIVTFSNQPAIGRVHFGGRRIDDFQGPWSRDRRFNVFRTLPLWCALRNVSRAWYQESPLRFGTPHSTYHVSGLGKTWKPADTLPVAWKPSRWNKATRYDFLLHFTA